jgi:hypothetical protein
MPILLILVNIVLAYFIGFLGRNRKLGFWGHFFCSLLLTPVIGLLLIVATDPVRDDAKLKEKLRKEIEAGK